MQVFPRRDEKIHFATYGDNVNFLDWAPTIRSHRAAALYKNGPGILNRLWKKLTNIVPWAEASYPGIVQAISDLQGDAHAAEGQIQFETPTVADINAPCGTISRLLSICNRFMALAPDMKEKLKTNSDSCLLSLPAWSAYRGNTDNVGGAAMNRTLSERRAKSVADYLVKIIISIEQVYNCWQRPR